MINFHMADREVGLIDKIAYRALGIDMRVNRLNARRKQDWMMDFAAVNNTCPLDLERLLEADEFNFVHDAFGIARHLDRTTGRLEHSFRPRFTLRARNGETDL